MAMCLKENDRMPGFADLSDPWNALAAGKGVIISEALIPGKPALDSREIALETPLASGVSSTGYLLRLFL